VPFHKNVCKTNSYFNSDSHIFLTHFYTAALFACSIKENIAYATNASDEDIIKAAKEANAHNFIMQFKQGYNTRVGEKGVRLSGGQRQRIAIARALLKNPRM